MDCEAILVRENLENIDDTVEASCPLGILAPPAVAQCQVQTIKHHLSGMTLYPPTIYHPTAAGTSVSVHTPVFPPYQIQSLEQQFCGMNLWDPALQLAVRLQPQVQLLVHL